MAQPSALSALYTASEIAVVMEASLEAESVLNTKGWDRRKSLGSHELLRVVEIYRNFLAEGRMLRPE